jgi:3-oxoacyl-[acyl-carrier protein] reductase
MKYALVTGGSRGIGRAVCIKLASMGYYVLINFLSNSAEADKTLEMIKKAGGKGDVMEFDVSDPEAVEKAIINWNKSHKDDFIEVLVNNAGIKKDTLLTLMEEDEWHDVLDIDLNGFFYVTKALLENMIERRYGRIINMSSLAGLQGIPGQVNYSAAKAALIGATKALAKEVGKRNITVNAVAPGYINTDMTRDLNKHEITGMIPLNRFGTPEEVAELVGFLASEKSSYITGEVISVSGGL